MLTVTYSNSNAAVDGISSSAAAEQPRRTKNRFMGKPSWLLLSISDMEDKIQAVNGENKPDTFGERADFYYRKRPELLALLQDLYNRYLYLADRYTRTLSKQQKQEQLQEQQEICTIVDHMINTNAEHSDVESSLSYQFPHNPQKPSPSELVISELIMKFVEYEIAVDELQNLEMIQEESKKKIELQKSLLDVLESERVVLTNENSRLASESLFMKRKAGELARCALLERTEDQRVFVLSCKIDDLQGQIYELEKRNKEYYDKLMKHQVEANKSDGKNNISINIKRLMVKHHGGGDVSSSSSISWSGEDETGGSMSSTSNSSTCTSLAQVMKDKKKKKKYPGGIDGGKKMYGWWDRMKKFDMFMCGPNLDATC